MATGHTDRLEILLQSIGSATEPEIKLALSRLSAELKERRAKGAESSINFFTTAVRALSKIKGVSHAETRMSCLHDSAMFLFSNERATEAMDAVRQMDNLSRRTGDKKWARLASNLAGIIYADLGNVADAVANYAASLSVAQEIHDDKGEVAVLLNLGAALNYAGLYHEALPCLRRCVLLSQTRANTRDLGLASLCNLAQSHQYLGEFAQGFDAISRCLAESKPPHDAESALNRTTRELTYVQLALEVGKLSSARQHAGWCREYATLSGSVRARFMSDIASGLCEIHGGDISKGLGVLEKALLVGGETASMRIEALTALVKAHDYAGQPERALECMRELLGYIRATREKGLLALLNASPNFEPARVASEFQDLGALTTREANLRAQVAERELMDSRIEMFERLAVAADMKEESSGEHGYRVGKIAALIAEELDWSRDACYAIDLAARVHDIGKIGVPDRILLNSQALRDAERHFMSTHTTIGAELLAKSSTPQLRIAEEIARFHHEWWNGEGYPTKLAGKRIPIHARIVALADVFDALTHGRPFAKPWPMDKALAEIRSRRGTQFDPELTDIFLELIARLRVEHENLDEFLGKAGRSSPFLQARNKIRLMLAEQRDHEKKATVAGNETRH